MVCQVMRRLPWIGKLRVGVVAACTGAFLVAACSGTTPSDSAPPSGPSASPTSVGARLATAIDQELSPGRDSYSQVRAVLVLVNGRTVFERYYQSSPEQYRNVFSVTKSVMSTLVGIAVGEGRLHLDDTLAELLPKYAARMSPAVGRTTLQQVLTMTAGFAGEFATDDLAFTRTADWVSDILRHPTGPPGGTFAYSNGTSHLLSAIPVDATGMSVLDYARARLLDPLGIATRPAVELLFKIENLDAYLAADFAWSIDPQGRHTGFSDLKLRPQDMAKIGTPYLDGGRWAGRQIVPAAWVRDATTRRVATPPAHPADGYGYQWWVTTAGEDPAFFALGFGGQRIEVIPRLGLVVAISIEVDEKDPTDRGVDGTLLTYLVHSVIAPTLR